MSTVLTGALHQGASDNTCVQSVLSLTLYSQILSCTIRRYYLTRQHYRCTQWPTRGQSVQMAEDFLGTMSGGS